MPASLLHPVLALLLGVALAACGLPTPWSALSALPLAAIFAHASGGARPRHVAGRLFWAGLGYFTVHLWWLTTFLQDLLGAGALASLLFVLEAGFLAALGLAVGALFRSPVARLWGLAGGWVGLEWLRFLGPLAFPWPTIGSTLLPTPAMQIADLGGVLLGSVLVTGTASALAQAGLALAERRIPARRWGRAARPLLVAAAAWGLAVAYGVTRTPAQGPEHPMLVLRSPFDSQDRASQALTPEQQVAQLRAASRRRSPDEIVVWSETALTGRAVGRPERWPDFPAPGISGVGGPLSADGKQRYNAVVAIDGAGNATGWNDKAKLVPFGEVFPFPGLLGPVYSRIEAALNYVFPVMVPNAAPTPLRLAGVSYGTYICYDSVFPWVTRALAAQGAQVLVNSSNDGWYKGWGVQQHFQMGRVRAIETRRWVVRSVNGGVAGSINELGQPVDTVQDGGSVRAVHVRPRLLTATTLYTRLGDLPALGLAALMVLGGLRRELRFRREGDSSA